MKSTALKVKAVSDKILKTEKYPWKKLLAYQPPGLKKTTPELLEKLKASLLNNGMASTFYVWQKGKEVFSLDGHHRCMALYELEKEGHAVPDKFTCSFLNIKTEKEAKTVFMATYDHWSMREQTWQNHRHQSPRHAGAFIWLVAFRLRSLNS